MLPIIRKHLKQFISLVLATIVVISAITSHAIAQTTTGNSSPTKGVVVRSGTSNWIEERFQAEIINIGLEKLGYKIAPIVEVAYPALFTSVANGDLDIAPVFGEPTYNPLFNNAGGAEKLEKVGVLFPVKAGYQIDKRTADRYGITNIQQLQDPKLAQLFDFDGNGKANLIGCDPGWDCEITIDHQLKAYKLQRTVEVNKGNYLALVADTIARYQQGKPIFFYAYEPFWLGEILKNGRDVTWLEVPFTTYPKANGTVTEKDTSVDGKNLGLIQGRYRTVANKKFLADNPPVKQFLELVKIPPEDMLRESYRVKNGESKPADLRRHAEEWIQNNQTLFDNWLAQVSQTEDKAPSSVNAVNQSTPAQSGLNLLLNPFQIYTLPLANLISAFINFLVDHFRPFFQTIRIPINWVLTEIRTLFLVTPPLIFLLLVSGMAWLVAGGGVGLYSVLALSLIGFMGLWEAAMISLALVVTSVIFCVVVGIPLGVLSARNDRFNQILKPLLDAMQTLPTFVYLVPVVMLFGIGEVPGIIATVVYALPPLIRLTNLGLRQVSQETVEAARAFGSTPQQILWEVQIPLAIPTILAGVNQTVLFALGITVIASMIAVPGLGLTVLQGMGRLDVGTAAVGGLAIVLLAILLDRLTQAIGKIQQFSDQ